MAAFFFLIGDDIYKRSYDGPYLRCISEEEGKYFLKEIQECCDDHPKSRGIMEKALKAYFFWNTMKRDAEDIVIHCGKCHRHAPLVHVPA